MRQTWDQSEAQKEIEVIVNGFVFPEGPAFDATGQFYVCDVRGRTIYKVDLEGHTKEIWMRFDGQPNGATKDPIGGGLLIADSLRKRIVRLGLDRSIWTLVEHAEFLGPNDLTVDDDGVIYFSDPTWAEGHENIPQFVYALSPDGFLAKYGPFQQPNGIKYKDGRLFLAEGRTGIIWETTPERMDFYPWAIVECPQRQRSCALDGLEVDSAGQVYVAAYDLGAVAVFGPSGRQIDFLRFPNTYPTNLEFSEDEEFLLVTEARHGRLFRIPHPTSPSPITARERIPSNRFICCALTNNL